MLIIKNKSAIKLLYQVFSIPQFLCTKNTSAKSFQFDLVLTSVVDEETVTRCCKRCNRCWTRMQPGHQKIRK